MAKLPDTHEGTVIITGGSSGLGLASAVSLASKGYKVIVTARNPEKGALAVAEILKRLKEADSSATDVTFGVLDLESLPSVKAFSDWFLALNIPLHVLMLNAGMALVRNAPLIHGVEPHFFVNHLSQFFLVQLLLGKIKETASSGASCRIVFVASGAHEFVKKVPDWAQHAKLPSANLSLGDSFLVYGHSKLANVQLCIELSRRLDSENCANIFVNSLHPGAVNTGIGSKAASKGFEKLLLKVVNFFLKSPDEGALTQVFLSSSPDIVTKNIKGKYFVPTAQLKDASKIALNEESQSQLWQVSETLISDIIGK